MTKVHARKVQGALRPALAVVAILSMLLASAAQAQRTQLKPGWNLFSPQQDVEIGTQVSADAERQLPIWNDTRVDRYLNDLGRKLAEKAPGAKYPYQFKAVNDSSINAFALPGGFLYINRGTLEAADNEAQLAGVIAHEISHVALRHGTNQASKAYVAQVPLAILGGQLGSGSIGAVLAQVGAGFAVNSLLLKYSRDAERQADALGTQILYDSGYDPRAMAQFFDKIQAGGRLPEFFSSHPSPENRMKLINREVDRLGGNPPGSNTDSGDFRDIKRYAQSRPAAPQSGQLALVPPTSGSSSGRPQLPSSSVQRFENGLVRIEHPENWRASGQGDAVTFAPDGGLIADGQGNHALAYGMLVNVYEPHRDDYYQRLQPEGYGLGGARTMTVEQATDQLIEELRRSNPRMRVIQQHEGIRLAGERGLSTVLTNDSPLANTRERNWLVTVLRPEGLLFFVAVAPEREFDGYNRAFEKMFDSARFLGTAGSAPPPIIGQPGLPSERVRRFENALVRIDHPENWRASGQGDAVTFAPDGGLIADGQGNDELAYGMMINLYQPRRADYYQRLQPEGYSQGAPALTVEQATDQLIEELRQSNPQMRVIQGRRAIQIGGERGLSTVLTNDSPLANTRERNWLVTVLRPEGLLFFVAVAPEADFQDYNSAFGKMLDSTRFLGTDSGVTLYPGVTLYADAGFRGKTEVLSNSDPDLRDNAIGNDQVSSIRVPAGYVVTLYSDVNYGGRSVVLREDESDLSRTALGNDEVSSIRIEWVGTNR